MKLWIAISMLMLGHTASTDSLKDVAETKLLSEKIMEYFLKAEFVQGLGIAKAYWPLPPAEIDNLANQINTQWAVVRQRFGNTTGMEFVEEEQLGQSFVRSYFLHKFDSHAIYWQFTYYKPKTEWKINGITFKDELETLFVPTR